jgi:hypothetical protein
MYKDYQFFYINGCSHFEGGGLEEPEIRKDSVRSLYEKYYGVSWKNRSEVNFGSRLSEILNIPCVNDAKSGGGVDRVIRTTYDFIKKNWDVKDKFFLILEQPDSARCDVFFNKTKEYYIVNSKNTGKELLFQCATREYYNNQKFDVDMDLYQNDFKLWYENHFDYEEKSINDEKNFIGLYSFCKLNNIKIFLLKQHNEFLNGVISSDDVIKFDGYENVELARWVFENKKTIKDELNKFSIHINDQHPGFFGHIEYAKEIAKFLGYGKEINNFNKFYE